MKRFLTAIPAIVLLAGCDAWRQTPPQAEQAPQPVEELAHSVAALHRSVTRPGAPPPQLTGVEHAEGGNWWFYFSDVQDGAAIPDSGFHVEIHPPSRKVRVTNMAFSLHPRGAAIVSDGAPDFVSLEELKRIWRGEE